MATPDAGVRADWCNPGRVPFASNGGDSVCIDLNPAKGGTLGQVILMNHESRHRLRLAASFGELLVRLAEHYEEQAEVERFVVPRSTRAPKCDEVNPA